MQDSAQEIQLRLSLPEVNQILTALGEQPYSAVYQLIANIQHQAIAVMESSEGLIDPPSTSAPVGAKGGP